MVKQFKSLLPFILVAGLFSGGWEQDAIAKPKDGKIDTLLTGMEELTTTVQGVDANYSQRRGLIGKKQAEERFEKALFRYLMGDYKRSAPEFFILLETESLDGYDFKKEAEWYLVDSAFRIGQYAIVEEASYQIIEQGAGHLFFTDAVRILLESYGIRNRQDKFQEAMERFVLSGLVASSDSLNYSIGKALFWQEENARAKASLMEIEPDSPLYYKAQYFLGGILVSEGSYEDGLGAFALALNPDVQKPEERELNDLANLALARTHYELRQFTEAIGYYQNVGAESEYFVDRLYEMAWAFIGMERWDDAIGVIEVFLVAYPEDEHAIRFQNTLGDLYMKLQEYEKALMTYEKVSEQLQPVQQRLEEILKQEDIVKELLDARINDEYVDYDLPEYAQDMLLKNSTLSQASNLVSLSREQSQDVKKASDYADEIEAVLSNEKNGLYIFSKDRHSLRQVELSVLDTALQTLEEEIAILSDGASEEDKKKLEGILQDVALIRELFDETFVLNQSMEEMLAQYSAVINELQGEASILLDINKGMQKDVFYFKDQYSKDLESLPKEEAEFIDNTLIKLKDELEQDSDRLEDIMSEKTKTVLLANISEGSLSQYGLIIREVQGEARSVLNVNRGLQNEVEFFPDEYSEALSNLPPEESKYIEDTLADLKKELEKDSDRLKELASAKTRSSLMAKIPDNSDQNLVQNQLLELQRIHNKLLPFWSKGTAPVATKQNIEKIWTQARAAIDDVSTIYVAIDDLELRQKKIIARVLQEQQDDLASFSDEVIALAVRSEELGAQAAMRSFEVLNQHVEDRMLGADLGIVKVYWIRKTDIEDEIEQLQLEQATKMKELRNRFDLISSKLYSE